MDPWHHPMVAMIAACRANGILPVDGPFGDISDQENYIAQAERSCLLYTSPSPRDVEESRMPSSA